MCAVSVEVCRTIFTDDAVSDETISCVFPNSVHLLCAFHIIDLNVYKVAKKCHYRHADQLRSMLWNKVAHGRTIRDVDLAVRALEDLRLPRPLAASLRYWFGKVQQWAGPYIRNHFTLTFNGNTMGEVSFSAVMKWVSTPDHFEQLFFDLQERERTVTLIRQKQADDELMSISGSPSDPREIREARKHFSTHSVRLFQEQLEAVSCYNLLEIAVHSQLEARRFQVFVPQQKSVPREVATAASNGMLCCDCNLYVTAGITCSHMLVVLKYLGLALYHPSFFHRCWTRAVQIDFDCSHTGYDPSALVACASSCTTGLGEEEPGHVDFLPNEDDDENTVSDAFQDTVTAESQVPIQLSTSLVEDSPSKNPPVHCRYKSTAQKSKPSYAKLMKTCEDVCRC